MALLQGNHLPWYVACDLIPLAVLKLLDLVGVRAPDGDVACDLIPLAVLKLGRLALLVGNVLRVTCDLIPLAVLKRQAAVKLGFPVKSRM